MKMQRKIKKKTKMLENWKIVMQFNFSNVEVPHFLIKEKSHYQLF